VWLHSDNEEIYEPLGTATSLPLPQDMALCEDSSTRDIGDWGELLVNNYLQTVVVSSSVNNNNNNNNNSKRLLLLARRPNTQT